MTRILSILFIALMLAACGPAQLETQQPLPTASADWTSITFTQSGGIMGMLRTLEISHDGAWTATDERTDNTVRGQLSAEQLAELEDLIASTLSIQSPGQSGVCADCFIYSVEISSSGKAFTAQADDVNLEQSGLEPLVSFLTGLMNEALTQ